MERTYEVARCENCKVQLQPNVVMVNTDDPENYGHPVGNGNQCWPEGQTETPLFEVEFVKFEVDDTKRLWACPECGWLTSEEGGDECERCGHDPGTDENDGWLDQGPFVRLLP